MSEPLEYLLVYAALAELLIILVLLIALLRAGRRGERSFDEFGVSDFDRTGRVRDPNTGRFISTKDRN